jgi:hypothetical protein
MYLMNEETHMTTSRIDFISAERGGIELFPNDRNRVGQPFLDGAVGWADNASDLADLMSQYGLADRVMHSSTMDFASTEGFEDDDAAWAIWDEAVQEYNYLALRY